jgi:hypothetical protein
LTPRRPAPAPPNSMGEGERAMKWAEHEGIVLGEGEHAMN